MKRERVMASFAFFSKSDSGESICVNIDQIAYFTPSGSGATAIYFNFPDVDGWPWRINVSGDVNATERQIMKVHKRFGNDLNLSPENFYHTYNKYRGVDA
jgi:hypothetical protein